MKNLFSSPPFLQKERPFVLVKAFTIASLIVMLAATIFIAALNAHWVRNLLLEKSKEYNSLLVENLNHQIFLRFAAPVAFKYGEIKLREPEQSRLLDAVITSTLHSFHVEMVNIYGTDNIIGYSFDKEQVGREDAGGVMYEQAMQKETTSKLIQKGSFLELLFWFPEETKIVTFAPLVQEMQLSRHEEKEVIGVIEIVRDISHDYQQVFRLQGMIVASCAGVMGLLFIVLRFVVKQGERIIEERAEERLRLEEKLRKAAHLSAIGEMTAGVSHEIRNPLGIIKSSAQLMKKKMDKLEVHSTIPDIIIEESQRLNNIITDFLDFARPRQADLRPCDINDIINKNLSFLETQIQDQEIIIHKAFHDHLPGISADPDMLYQAFLNILLNCFQSVGKNGAITIVTDYDARRVFISFADNGPGIDEDTLEKIWTPFFTTKDTGTGLGLGIVKNIIEAHNGTIRISNGKPTGAVVDIALPI
ncbi:two-component system sensor histidine kinase NtrB [Desulfotignum balticum]|uniref:two-component system sensor histidine kinase NtrB n=1 Tax=Desulfotignum balticum TaxID=115781 RepID=UPI00041E8682|nr:ATP-binding protein [Desulfotignum balticum]